jgi:UDP-N-acetylglucosamine enolpyruvyl transferase
MTLAQAIAAEPYLKIANCTDIADVNYAIDVLRKLDAQYGQQNKALLKLWAKFLNKKAKMQA